jgi:hypothetical protein
MQAQAAEFSGYAGQPPSLFELRRVRKREKRSRHSEAAADPAAFWEEKFKNTSLRFHLFQIKLLNPNSELEPQISQISTN